MSKNTSIISLENHSESYILTIEQLQKELKIGERSPMIQNFDSKKHLKDLHKELRNKLRRD